VKIWEEVVKGVRSTLDMVAVRAAGGGCGGRCDGGQLEAHVGGFFFSWWWVIILGCPSIVLVVCALRFWYFCFGSVVVVATLMVCCDWKLEMRTQLRGGGASQAVNP
jgi:hypothetical protein